MTSLLARVGKKEDKWRRKGGKGEGRGGDGARGGDKMGTEDGDWPTPEAPLANQP